MEMTQEIMNGMDSLSDICRYYRWGIKGNNLKKAAVIAKKFNTSHFTNGNKKKMKYERVVKICPICESEFITLKGHKKEKSTCSRGCANSYFRRGSNHANWNKNTYRTTCFEKHKKECIICGESRIVEVHHFDKNSKNNNIENLIPLCSTHHRYVHSKYEYLIDKQIKAYRDGFLKKNI